MENRKPKSILINPQFQLKFLSYSLAIAGITFIVFLMVKITFFANLESHLLSMGLSKDHIVFDFLKSQSQYMTIAVLVAGFFEIALLTITGLVLSHRVSGPLYRLTQDLNAIADGKSLKEIRFRKNDFFPEVAVAANRVLFQKKK